jgi:hypothetical protein
MGGGVTGVTVVLDTGAIVVVGLAFGSLLGALAGTVLTMGAAEGVILTAGLAVDWACWTAVWAVHRWMNANASKTSDTLVVDIMIAHEREKRLIN